MSSSRKRHNRVVLRTTARYHQFCKVVVAAYPRSARRLA